jgi:hypothetical protein
MKKILIIPIVVILGFLYSCSEDWLEVKPKGESNESSFYSKAGLEALLIGVYSVADGSIGGGGDERGSDVENWIWGGIVSDDAYKGAILSDKGNEANEIEGFYINTGNVWLAGHWRTLYAGVARANQLLKILKEVDDITAEQKALIEAQTKFLRAHFYFELTIVHGKVPFIDENVINPTIVPNLNLVWPEIEADMAFAAENLPSKWSDKGRASKWAAKTYLARIYMFQGKFGQAKPLLQDVYSNGGFSLMPSYEQNYMIANNNNKESIFEIQYAVNDGFNGSPNAGYSRSLNFPAGVAGMNTNFGFYQPSHSLVSAFRVNNLGLPLLEDSYSKDDILSYSPTGVNVSYSNPVDPRLDHTIGRPGVPYLDWGIHKGHAWVRDASNGGPYLNKKNMFKSSEKAFSTQTGSGGVNANNFRKYRLGHVILWLAECEAEVGSLQNATNLVNVIRIRAKNSSIVRLNNGLPAANYLVEPYSKTFPTKEYARNAIRHEIRLEFAMEGLRFFDLVRWGIAGQVINNYLNIESSIMQYLKGRTFIPGQNEIWPIPQIQIDISMDENGNSVLKQNPGY